MSVLKLRHDVDNAYITFFVSLSFSIKFQNICYYMDMQSNKKNFKII